MKALILIYFILNIFNVHAQNAAFISIDEEIPDCFEDTIIVYDNPSTYNHDIFGIGNDTSLLFYAKKSTSVSYPAVTVETTTEISSNNYLVCGHNNNALSRITVGGENNVIQRTWFANMTGNIGTVTISLDLSLIGANTGLAPNQVKIGVANNPSLTNIYFIEASSVTSGIAIFEGVPLYDKYFTFKAAP